ncbi:MAG TPA: TetR family transcriptional regulator [Candidatus Dormibacteraeota bacterium]|nr:TetR family transcriptional regulator [Candidatus Dormibacteraeota bacterium]
MASGLRERKKLKTKSAIQREAIRLFLEQGYEDTTVEQIADAAEISPSTFFNYFSSKEDVVYQDELDPLILAAFNAEPRDEHPIAAMRHAMDGVFRKLTPEQDRIMRQRIALMSSTPSLRAAMLARFADMVDEIAGLVATRAGGSAKDFAVRNMAGALLGVMMSTLITMAEDPGADLLAAADEAMAHLEAGLPLDWSSTRRKR